MTKKTLAFKPAQKPAEAPDQWVNNREKGAKPVPAEKMKRLTIDIPETLHRRVKLTCVERDQVMADVLRDLISREFPA